MIEAWPNNEVLLEKEKINVMLVGNGGREHALDWKLSHSERIGDIFMVPDRVDPARYIRDTEQEVDLVIIGPDDPLADGVVDELRFLGYPTFGPTKSAAQIESDRPFSKLLMNATGVPTAPFRTFFDAKEAHTYVEFNQKPYYVKAGGLAKGKGALECLTTADAHQAITDILQKKMFGRAGAQIIIEEFLEGREISLHAVANDTSYLMFPSSQDYKKSEDGDKRLNTGGMGTITPVPWFNIDRVDRAGQLVVEPILRGLYSMGNDFNGLLFPGLMVNGQDTRVIEYNARFGDTETQVYMRTMKSDLLELIIASLNNSLDNFDLEWTDDFAVCIVAAGANYPDTSEAGLLIRGIKRAQKMDGVEIFLAGVIREGRRHYTAGGRILGVTAVGATLNSALDRGYAAMDEIRFEDKKTRADTKKIRTDIGSNAS